MAAPPDPVSEAQRVALLDWMTAHKALAREDLYQGSAAALEALATQLNGMDGITKSPQDWWEYWNELKDKVREKQRNILKHQWVENTFANLEALSWLIVASRYRRRHSSNVDSTSGPTPQSNEDEESLSDDDEQEDSLVETDLPPSQDNNTAPPPSQDENTVLTPSQDENTAPPQANNSTVPVPNPQDEIKSVERREERKRRRKERIRKYEEKSRKYEEKRRMLEEENRRLEEEREAISENMFVALGCIADVLFSIVPN